MNRTERDEIEIIKEALSGGAADLSAEPDWWAIYKDMSQQAVAPLGYEIYKKRKGSFNDTDLDREWSQSVIEQYNSWYMLMYCQQELVNLLSSAGFDFAIMKGMANAVLYPVPELRKSGDIDFLVREDEYESVYQLLLDNGYSKTEELDKAEYHVVLTKDDVVFELHKRPGGTKMDGSPESQALIDFFSQGLDNVGYVEVDKYYFPVLPTLQKGMTLLIHFAGHMREGVGIRHLLDWMVYAEHYLSDQYWEEYFCAEAEKVHLKDLAKVMTKVCQKCFGLNNELTWCRDADSSSCRRLLEYLISEGDFGKKGAFENRGIKLMSESQGLIGFLGRLNYSSKYSMPAARKNLLLRPFAWVYQIMRYLHIGLVRGNPLKKLSQDRKKSDEIKNLFVDLHI
ncbi:MAG: nucleotidyltransferase family protein [Lachnospiraceae bacterium]|nr:nucleotidyltransferase family protein [Lachnospiraceae bacterium]